MKKRYHFLDLIRGFAVVNMILYHGMWDLFYIYRVDIPYFSDTPAYIWQQCICHCFILLSGFSFGLGGRGYKRGVTVFLAGALVSLVTAIAMPSSRILFGVLTFLGSAMLLARAVYPIAVKIKPAIGMPVSFILFIITKSIGKGFLGIGDKGVIPLPEALYSGYISSFIGFPSPEFTSSDYFPLFPWLFLFFTGFYLFPLIKDKKPLTLAQKSLCKPLEFIGRHSLIIYLAHQPIIYLLLIIIFGGTQ